MAARGEHTCAGVNAEITFRRDGLVIGRFLRICGDSGSYWGGWSHIDLGPAYEMMTEHGMFQRIAKFAHDTEGGRYYELVGHGWTTRISTRMEADRIAGPLACDVARVRHYFALSVEVPEPDEVEV